MFSFKNIAIAYRNSENLIMILSDEKLILITDNNDEYEKLENNNKNSRSDKTATNDNAKNKEKISKKKKNKTEMKTE